MAKKKQHQEETEATFYDRLYDGFAMLEEDECEWDYSVSLGAGWDAAFENLAEPKGD